jgi:hypothetical protein
MNEALRDELVAMSDHDRAVRAELAADGSLFAGYHPRMEDVRRANAARLREIVAEFGWPGRALVGDEGADAAWLVAQHAIGEPPFMRMCRDLLDAASARGDAPRWQFAYIDDRIRVFEGSPQRYGTQFRDWPDGPQPYPLEDASRVEAWRRELGMPSLEAIVAKARAEYTPGRLDLEAAELAWRREVGWIP